MSTSAVSGNLDARAQYLRDQADKQSRKAIETDDPTEAQRLSQIAQDASAGAAALQSQKNNVGRNRII